MKDEIKISKWMDWYWNKGGRDKVQARRYINEYKRYNKNPEELIMVKNR